MQSEVLSGSVVRTNTFGVYTSSTAMPQVYVCFQAIVSLLHGPVYSVQTGFDLCITFTCTSQIHALSRLTKEIDPAN